VKFIPRSQLNAKNQEFLKSQVDGEYMTIEARKQKQIETKRANFELAYSKAVTKPMDHQANFNI
jgi:hypothetical protein